MSGAVLLRGAKVGEYEIAEKLAEGGMGVVYAAVHPVIGKRAAIKVMSATLCADDEAVSRFVQEARAVNHIGHPNIVDIFSIGELIDGRSYFVMEWLPGESLGKRLEQGPMSLVDAVAIIDQIADAVSAAHSAGIVHRDLKPDNVMLVERGDRSNVKLLDFGIAKLADPDGRGYIAHTKTGLVMGTPGYMSPEQARGKHVDERTDIYSLGCIAYELLTGSLPYDADNSMDIVIKHVQDPVPRVSASRDLPDMLDELVASMMAKSASQRPSLSDVRATAAKVAQALEVTSEFASARFTRMATPLPSLRAGTQPAEFAATAATAATAPLPRYRKLGFIAAMVGAAIAAVVAVLVLKSGGEKEPEARAASTEEIPAQQPAPLAAQPRPAGDDPPQTARLRVAAPKGSVVSLDDAVIGETGGEVVAEQVRPGKHLLAVRQPGFVAYSQWIEIASGDDVEVPVVLTPEPDLEPGPPSQVRPGSKKTPKATSAKKQSGKRGSDKSPGATPKDGPAQGDKAKPASTVPGSHKSPDKDYTLNPFAR